MNQVSAKDVSSYFAGSAVLEHYEKATEKVGLWNSEKVVFSKTFPDKSCKLLELGCGTGRISFGLWRLGYRNLLATDFSKPMIRKAKRLNRKFKTEILFKVEDAISPTMSEQSIDGVIFGFNGLMQIPLRENRQKVMLEVNRSLTSGSYFVFTTHDRSMPKWKKFWSLEKKKWKRGEQNPKLLEFGDRFEETPKGKLYIHVPEVEEIRRDLIEAGFSVERDILRSKISQESRLVKEYSDECRFWIAKKK